MPVTVEWDAFGAGAYDTTNTGEQSVTVNGIPALDVPFGWISAVLPGTIPPCTSSSGICYYSNWDNTWNHVGPCDITALVNSGANTLLFSDLLSTAHLSGIRNVVVKQDGIIVFGPAQGNPDLSTCVANGLVNDSCINIKNLSNGTLTQSFTFSLGTIAQAPTISSAAVS